jgi:polysaccharide export outer membrane protein
MLMSERQNLQKQNQAITAGISRIILGVMFVCFVGACASNGNPAAAVTPTNAAVSEEYRIGPGDALQIFVWDHADLSIGVQVRPDGKISTPLVEDLQAAGRTPTELARDIELVLMDYVRAPVVTVIMQGFVGEGQQQIRVVGQAVSPKALQFRQGMTVLDVMIEVGGLSEFAAGNRAKIIRKSNGGQIEIRVRLDDLLNDGDIGENVNMLPGDVLIIPESWF